MQAFGAVESGRQVVEGKRRGVDKLYCRIWESNVAVPSTYRVHLLQYPIHISHKTNQNKAKVPTSIRGYISSRIKSPCCADVTSRSHVLRSTASPLIAAIPQTARHPAASHVKMCKNTSITQTSFLYSQPERRLFAKIHQTGFSAVGLQRGQAILHVAWP